MDVTQNMDVRQKVSRNFILAMANRIADCSEILGRLAEKRTKKRAEKPEEKRTMRTKKPKEPKGIKITITMKDGSTPPRSLVNEVTEAAINLLQACEKAITGEQEARLKWKCTEEEVEDDKTRNPPLLDRGKTNRQRRGQANDMLLCRSRCRSTGLRPQARQQNSMPMQLPQEKTMKPKDAIEITITMEDESDPPQSVIDEVKKAALKMVRAVEKKITGKKRSILKWDCTEEKLEDDHAKD